jgi:hypothetical protein
MNRYCIILLLSGLACGGPENADPNGDMAASGAALAELQLAEETKLDELLAQYVPFGMSYDASGLPADEKALLQKLVEASRLIDELYLQQTSTAGVEYRKTLDSHTNHPLARKALILLIRNAMPFDQLQEHSAFVGGDPYYPGHEIYPRGMTAEQFDSHLETLSEKERSRFMDPYTVIREDAEGGYRAIPYHEEYRDQIQAISALLREAADLAANESFRKYLRLKADALETDQYFAADVAWIDLAGNKYDIVIGPFETYSDGIKGVKAKYESFVEVVDQEESEKLEIYKQYLPDLENNLPIPDVYKSNVEGLSAKFVIVQDIHRGGEAAAGYQAVAANLPNDPEVHAQKGTVKTFWRNMFHARFETIIRPVSERLIAEEQLEFLSADGFFQVVLMHEICHALGPRVVKVGPNKGQATNAAIGPAYNALEESKATIAGLLSLAWLMDEGVVDPADEKKFYVSSLGSMFRSVRFGVEQAHGRAAALALHYLTERGALSYDADSGRWSIEFDRFRDGVRSLAEEVLTLLGEGDSDAVNQFLDSWTGMSPELEASLAKVADLPTDVMPSYQIKWN